MSYTQQMWTEFLIFVGFLTPISICDIREKRIPDKYIILGFVFIFLLRMIFGLKSTILWFIFDSAIGFFIIWILWFFTKNKIGLGDAKLSAFIAFMLGLSGWVITLLLASIMAISLILILLFLKKMKKKEGIPFAPFLAVGGIFSFFIKHFLIKDLICII